MGRRLLKDIFVYDFFNFGWIVVCFKILGKCLVYEGVYYFSKYKQEDIQVFNYEGSWFGVLGERLFI